MRELNVQLIHIVIKVEHKTRVELRLCPGTYMRSIAASLSLGDFRYLPFPYEGMVDWIPAYAAVSLHVVC